MARRLIIIGFSLLAVTLPSSGFADEGAEANAREAAAAFLKAVKADDLEATLKVCGLPWIDPFEERIITDQSELRRFWKTKLAGLDRSQIHDETTTAMAFREFRQPPEKTGDVDFDTREQQVHKEVIGDLERVLDRDGWLVTFADKNDHEGRVVFVRMRDGKPAVVGGPAGLGYLHHANRIPKMARTQLDESPQLEVLSLNPVRSEEKPENDFHGWAILGKTSLECGADRDSLVSALKQSAEEADAVFAGCFSPRHGIRVTHKGKTVDFVICFECLSTLVFFDGSEETGFQISRSGQPTFDKILRAAQVPLAEKGGQAQ